MAQYEIADEDGWEEIIDTAWATQSWAQQAWRPKGVEEKLHRMPDGWVLETVSPCCSISRISGEEAHAWLRAEGCETPKALADELGLEAEECEGGLDDEAVEELYKVLGGR